MALVNLEGIYMNYEIQEEKKYGDRVNPAHILLDIYQPNSPDKEKMVQVKVDDLTLAQTLSKDYDMGSIIKVECTTTAYQNKTYFKLNKLFEGNRKTA